MYTIAVRIGLFRRRIKVTDHKLDNLLQYLTVSKKTVLVPVSALKEFVVYPDYWQHLKELEQAEIEAKEAAEIQYQESALQKQNEKLAQELETLKSQMRKAQPEPMIQRSMPPMKPQPTAEEVMHPEILRRVNAHLNGIQEQSSGFQQT